MSEIVERMALALFNHDMSRFTTQQRIEWTEEDLMPEHGSADIYRGRARVAIKAMWMVTPRMIEVGNDAISKLTSLDAQHVYHRMMIETWSQDMLDEIE